MAWDFETDPEFQEKLDWIDNFLTEKIEPIDLGVERFVIQLWDFATPHSIELFAREVIPAVT